MPKEWSPKELRHLADQEGMDATLRSAFNFIADLFEMASDDRFSTELIGIRVRNQLQHL